GRGPQQRGASDQGGGAHGEKKGGHPGGGKRGAGGPCRTAMNAPVVAHADLKIVEVTAYPTSFPVPPGQRVTLGIGTSVKRDAVVVRVKTAGGLVGWGESHHGRAHTAVAKLVETTL